MLKRLLIRLVSAKVEEIGLDLVQNELGQMEYYTERVHNMVGRVLRKNGVVDRDKCIYQSENTSTDSQYFRNFPTDFNYNINEFRTKNLH